MSEYVDEAVRRAKTAMDDPDVNPVAWGLAMAKLPIKVWYDEELKGWAVLRCTGSGEDEVCDGYLHSESDDAVSAITALRYRLLQEQAP